MCVVSWGLLGTLLGGLLLALFSGGESEAQRGVLTCLRSHRTECQSYHFLISEMAS